MRYFSMFTGVGGFELGIRQAYDKRERSIISKFIERFMGNSEPVCVGVCEYDKYASRVLRKRFPEVRNYGDATKIDTTEIPRFHLLVAGFPCFTGDTIILTKEGFKEIKDVQIGDEVFTHKRRWRKVTEKHKRFARTRKVKAQGIVETYTTDEHPFYTRERKFKWDNTRRRYIRKFEEPKWVQAKELQGSYIGQTYPDAGRIEGSYDFWWVVGRYIADGWLVNRKNRGDGQTCRVVICSGHHKSDEAEKRIGKVFNYAKVKERTVTKFHITNKEFGEFLKPVGRKAHNKKIPIRWFGMDENQAKGFFEGYLSGDGGFDGKIWKASTTSKKLAIGLAMFYRKYYGRMVSIYYQRKSPKTIIEGREVNQRPYYVLSFWKYNRSGYVDGEFNWGLCRESKEDIEKDVYNIGVEEDESYIANNGIVHNCQSFSVAGKRGGFEDTRGTMFFQVARVIRDKRPPFVLLENVKGLQNHDKGKTFATIISTLSELGYHVEFGVLNSRYHGVPQNRERIFIIGSLGRRSGREVFPLGESDREDIDKTQGKIITAGNVNPSGKGMNGNVYNINGVSPNLTTNKGEGIKVIGNLYPSGHEAGNIYDKNGLSPTIKCNGPRPNMKNVSPKIVEKRNQNAVIVWDDYNQKRKSDEIACALTQNTGSPTERNGQKILLHTSMPGKPRKYERYSPTITTPSGGGYLPYVRACLTPDRLNKRQNGRRLKEIGEPSFTLTGLDIYGVMVENKFQFGKHQQDCVYNTDSIMGCLAPGTHGMGPHLTKTILPDYRIRRLTPRECERLQGFPDDFSRWGIDEEGKEVEMSDSQRYKMMGNAVTVNVVQAIMERLDI